MRQVEYVEALTPEEFAEEYNQIASKINQIGEIVDHYIISATSAHIFYEFQDEEEPEEEKPVIYCADCDNYDWGKGCPYREGRVDRLDLACEMFNVKVGEVLS